MTNKLTFLLVMFASLVMSAQGTFGPISITHGQEIEQDKEKIVKIAGETNNKIYTLATKGKNYFIKVFKSEDMSLISVNEIEMPDFIDKEPQFEQMVVMNDKIYIIGSVYDKKNKEANLLAVQVNEDGTLSDKRVKLFNTQVTKNKERGAFYFSSTPNGDHYLMMHASLFDKEEVIQYEVKFVDENMNIVMSNLEKVPFTDRKDLEFTLASWDVNVYNDVFLVINESYRDKKAKTNIEKLQLHTFKSANGYQKEVVNIDLPNKEIINCQMMANNKNQIHMVGFYSNVDKKGKAERELEGVYAVNVDGNTDAVTGTKFTEFDYETKVKLLGERKAKKDKDVQPLYLPYGFMEKEDGGLIMLSEYRLMIFHEKSGIGPLAVQPITYIQNEIIVTSINPDGSVAWTNVAAKKQKVSVSELSFNPFAVISTGNLSVTVSIEIPLTVLGKGPEYLGAMPIYENDELTLVFNDNEKNIGVTDIDEIKALGNYNKAIPTAFKFDRETGEITRIDSAEYQKDQLIFRPGVFYRKSPTEYIIYSSRKSQDKLGRMYIASEGAM
ncbi:hypothetical protein [Mangrovimonas xylaniphaga]|uniref:hypothetical protein n=1 Tax=Mangrovimonas xylaniphaga TaxID=1645915 RepID=UPI0006B59F07|nr:hypothetical protein [Mangrovimonas xylaniphaga]